MHQPFAKMNMQGQRTQLFAVNEATCAREVNLKQIANRGESFSRFQISKMEENHS